MSLLIFRGEKGNSRMSKASNYVLNGLWQKNSVLGAELETGELLYGLIRHNKPLTVLETGCATGDTAMVIGQALLDNGQGQLFTCDLDEERVKETEKRTKGLPVQVNQTTGVELISRFESIDFIFIDSGWSPVRQEEVAPAFHRLREGGLMVMHDVCQNYNEVYKEGVALFGKHGLVLDSPYGLAIFQKGDPQFTHLGVMVDLVKI